MKSLSPFGVFFCSGSGLLTKVLAKLDLSIIALVTVTEGPQDANKKRRL